MRDQLVFLGPERAEQAATEPPTTPEPIPLPVDLDEYEEERERLEAAEQPAPALLLLTLPDAQRAAARAAKIRADQALMASIYDSELERKRREIEALEERKAEALRPYERRASWYEAALEQFHREQIKRDPKVKTIKLPAGDLRLRRQQPEWHYGADLVERLKEIKATAYIRIKEEPDKAALKKAARVVGCRAALLDPETGELVELPIEVVERPPRFEFQPAEVSRNDSA